MGLSFDEIMLHDRISEGWMVHTTLVTMQDDGIASYAHGTLAYHPGGLIGTHFRLARLSSTQQGLKYLFSNRGLDIDADEFAIERQPFSANKADNLGMVVEGSVAILTLRSWGDQSFSIALAPLGKMMHGFGPAIPGSGSSLPSENAAYIISFDSLTEPPR